jgi:hypothetical protein
VTSILTRQSCCDPYCAILLMKHMHLFVACFHPYCAILLMKMEISPIRCMRSAPVTADGPSSPCVAPITGDNAASGLTGFSRMLRSTRESGERQSGARSSSKPQDRDKWAPVLYHMCLSLEASHGPRREALLMPCI